MPDSPENKCPTVECPDCGGQGSDEGGFRGGKKWKAICPRCGGSGRINTSGPDDSKIENKYQGSPSVPDREGETRQGEVLPIGEYLEGWLCSDGVFRVKSGEHRIARVGEWWQDKVNGRIYCVNSEYPQDILVEPDCLVAAPSPDRETGGRVRKWLDDIEAEATQHYPSGDQDELIEHVVDAIEEARAALAVLNSEKEGER